MNSALAKSDVTQTFSVTKKKKNSNSLPLNWDRRRKRLKLYLNSFYYRLCVCVCVCVCVLGELILQLSLHKHTLTSYCVSTVCQRENKKKKTTPASCRRTTTHVPASHVPAVIRCHAAHQITHKRTWAVSHFIRAFACCAFVLCVVSLWPWTTLTWWLQHVHPWRRVTVFRSPQTFIRTARRSSHHLDLIFFPLPCDVSHIAPTFSPAVGV